MATVTISSIAVCIFKEDIFSRDILCPILLLIIVIILPTITFNHIPSTLKISQRNFD